VDRPSQNYNLPDVYPNRRPNKIPLPPVPAGGASSLLISVTLLNVRNGIVITQGDVQSPALQSTARASGGPISDAAIAINNAGVKLTEAGRYSQAVSEFTTALGYAPYFAIALNNRGVAYAYLGQYDMALADFNNALRYNPLYSDADTNRNQLKSVLQLK
jgi:tetratricopeptide (TPR) repeat protein